MENQSEPRNSQPKLLLQNLGITFFSIIIALSIAEVALRVNEPSYYQKDDILGVIGKPGGEFDANGFRNKSVIENPAVVAIGDSQTYGDNANPDEAWPQQLSVIASTTVYQMAWGGYGPIQYLSLLDRALILKPKVVVVGFYLGNDLENAAHTVYQDDKWARFKMKGFVPDESLDATNDVQYSLQTGLPPGSWRLKFYEWRLAIRQNSRVYTLLGNSTRELRERFGLARTIDQKKQALQQFSEDHPDLVTSYTKAPIATLLSPSYRANVVDLNNAFTKEGWRISEEVFNEMAERTRKSGATFVIAVIPTKEYVYAQYMKKEGTLPKELSQYAEKEELLHGAIKQYCSENSMNCVFTVDALVNALGNNIAIYPPSGNSHPVAAGYRVIAESIAKAKVTQ